ncbi:MAG: 30S ribosomal protein S4 [Candidatus Margulisbacteria bacterium]|nr:30S ribosomal protein S4 [Candidatus Margulisiibacteriota bacterium]
MGRQTGPRCKICRREKEKLFLKGEKCATEKCPFSRRSAAGGKRGRMPLRMSEYGIRLREKQKARRIYGLTERQFEKYFDEASARKESTAEMLFAFLERRLDNVVFRAGFVESRRSARQVVHHGGILVNGKKVDVPSYRVREGDAIKVAASAVPIMQLVQKKMPDYTAPAWLTVTGEGEAKVASIPKRSEIDTAIEDHLIVEYYSR